MHSPILKYLKDLQESLHLIKSERKLQLDRLAKIINDSPSKELIFICTHNSRRSHFAQIWMQVSCAYLGLKDKVKTFSGGTEATALNPRTAAAVSRLGFEVSLSSGNNPLYQIGYHPQLPSIEAFSKVYSHEINPQRNFIAIMTCDEAAEACPIVSGASQRFNLSYKDPKIADDSPEEHGVYDERCQEIAREMLYLASKVQ